MDNTSSAQKIQSKLALRSHETGDTFALSGEMLIGREVECDIQLKSIQVSRYHAKIIVAANAIFVEDLQSSNGTFVNGMPVKRRTEIGLGDQVAFDDVVFRVTSMHAGGAEETMMAGQARLTGDDSQPSDLTRRKRDIRPQNSGSMTIARPSLNADDISRFEIAAEPKGKPKHGPKSKPKSGSNSASSANSASGQKNRRQSKKTNKNKLILASLLLAVLVLGLASLIFLK